MGVSCSILHKSWTNAMPVDQISLASLLTVSYVLIKCKDRYYKVSKKIVTNKWTSVVLQIK